jgi:MFS family permease
MTSSQVDTHRISEMEVKDTSEIESISLSSANMSTGTPSSPEPGANLPSQKFIATMDIVIVATALPAIAHGLNAQSNSAYWIGSAFLFAQAVSQPLYGTMSDLFGRKACYLFAMGVFTLASLFCALARGPGWLIAARVVSFWCLFPFGCLSGDALKYVLIR